MGDRRLEMHVRLALDGVFPDEVTQQDVERGLANCDYSAYRELLTRAQVREIVCGWLGLVACVFWHLNWVSPFLA